MFQYLEPTTKNIIQTLLILSDELKGFNGYLSMRRDYSKRRGSNNPRKGIFIIMGSKRVDLNFLAQEVSAFIGLLYDGDLDISLSEAADISCKVRALADELLNLATKQEGNPALYRGAVDKALKLILNHPHLHDKALSIVKAYPFEK